MNKTILTIGSVLLIVNIIFGVILPLYQTFNVGVNSFVIVLTAALIFSLNKLKLRDAFCISLTAVFATCGIGQFVLGVFSPISLINNWYLIAIVVILTFEVILLILSSKTSKMLIINRNKEYESINL